MNLQIKDVKKKKKDLDRKVNRDDLIQTYKGNTSDLNFDEFDNALNIINKNKMVK